MKSGWMIKKRGMIAHYFQNDSLSLCGRIRLVTSRISFVPNNIVNMNYCHVCQKILTSYNDLNNFSHDDLVLSSLYKIRSEW